MTKKNFSVSLNIPGGFCGLLTILFIALKLTGHINWSWVWVLAPMWVGIAFAITIVLFLAVVVGIVALVSS